MLTKYINLDELMFVVLLMRVGLVVNLLKILLGFSLINYGGTLGKRKMSLSHNFLMTMSFLLS